MKVFKQINAKNQEDQNHKNATIKQSPGKICRYYSNQISVLYQSRFNDDNFKEINAKFQENQHRNKPSQSPKNMACIFKFRLFSHIFEFILMMNVFQQVNAKKKQEDHNHNKAFLKAQKRLTGIFSNSSFQSYI